MKFVVLASFNRRKNHCTSRAPKERVCESKERQKGKQPRGCQQQIKVIVTRLRHSSRMQRFRRELQIVYGSLSSPKASLPENLNDSQTELVAALLDEGHFKLYPPSIEYQKAFWRHVILSIENSGNVSECA